MLVVATYPLTIYMLCVSMLCRKTASEDDEDFNFDEEEDEEKYQKKTTTKRGNIYTLVYTVFYSFFL